MRNRQNPILCRIGLVFCAVAGFFSVLQASAESYTITDLGKNIVPHDISNNGIIAGAGVNQSSFVAIVRKNGTIQQVTSSALESRANAVNSSERVVGYEKVDATQKRAFLWQESKGFTPLGAVEAWDVSEFDQVTGEALENGQRRAFLYNAMAGRMRTVSPLPGGSEIWARGINSFAAIAGTSYAADGAPHAFIYSDVNGLHQLDEKRLPGFIGSEAMAVNDSSQVVGWMFSDFSSSNSSKRAFVWVRGPEMQDLGVIGKDVGSSAYDINNAGHVVGYSALSDGVGMTRAFFHDRKSSGVVALMTGVVNVNSQQIVLVFLGTASNGVFVSGDGGASIVSRNQGLTNSNITALVSGGTNILYAGTAAGVYKTTDASFNWSAVNTGLVYTDNLQNPPEVIPRINTLVVDPKDALTVYAGTPVGVYRSTDGGANWSAFNVGFAQVPAINNLTVGIAGSSTIIYAATSGGVYQSVAGGGWGLIQGDLQERNIQAIAVGVGALYVGISNGVYKGTEAAGSWQWTEINDGLPPSRSVRTLQTYCPISGACTIYAGLSGGPYKRIEGSTTSWAGLPSAGLTNSDIQAVAVAPTTPSPTVFAGTQSGMFRITEGDTRWTLTNNMQDLSGLVVNRGNWILSNASAINNAGQIVGWGVLSGEIHGFLLTPTTGVPTAKLAITKTLSPGPYQQFVPVTYTLTVTNNGPDKATGVTVADWLPDNVIFRSSQGTSCDASNDNILTCKVADLEAGKSLSVRIVVSPNGPDVTFNNTARVIANEANPEFSSIGNSSVGASTNKCFIATAAYGSFLDPHVQALRDFRDEHLLTNALGRDFVAWYYRNSPPLAAFIARHEGLRMAARAALTPVVYAVKYPWSALGLFLVGAAGLLMGWRRRTLLAT